MKNLISNCFLCGEKSLHVAGTEESQVMQCINCGYTTSTKFTGTKNSNKDFQKLGEDMKNWAVEKNGKIWIPSEKGGFYEKKIDTDNPFIYELFIDGMTYVNELLKKNSING